MDPELVMITSPEQCAELAQVLADVWGFAESSAVASPDTLRAMTYSGCYVAGVLVDGRLVGGGFGWPTYVTDDPAAGEWRLHSHVIGFLDGYRALGLGARIKHHQRDFVRARGMQAVEWTFDPLVAANARFNLYKLGARVIGFHNDFYGKLEDEFSAGLGSDRFVVRWGVDDAPPTADAHSADHERPAILTVAADGSPVVTPSDASRVIAHVPPNIVELRKSNTALALAWRDAFAQTVGAEILRGSRIVGITNDLGYLIDR